MQHQVSDSKGKGIAAMVLGIVSLVIPFVGLATAPIAIALAGVSMRRHEPGRGQAITGLTTGIVAASGYAAWLIMLAVGGVAAVGA